MHTDKAAHITLTTLFVRDATQQDRNDIGMLIIAAILRVNILNQTLHAAFFEGNTYPIAIVDDVKRNFCKCLDDIIAGLDRGEAYDIPVSQERREIAEDRY
jgi:hypothetical protein